MIHWYNTIKKELISLQCTSPKRGEYLLRLCPNSKNMVKYPKDTVSDIRVTLVEVTNKPTLQQVKDILLSLVQEYDSSKEVNSFILNGQQVWLDKATRVGLVNALTLAKSRGESQTTIWFNGDSISLDIDKAMEILSFVESYAMQCYNKTQQHIVTINSKSAIDELLTYDFTEGYPELLNITIE